MLLKQLLKSEPISIRSTKPLLSDTSTIDETLLGLASLNESEIVQEIRDFVYESKGYIFRSQNTYVKADTYAKILEG